MKLTRKTILVLISVLAFSAAGAAEIAGLAQLYTPGKTLLDLDGDGFPEKLPVTIIIPDRPTAAEMALAADIAARFNYESLAVDFNLVKRESEIGDLGRIECPIFIGTNLKWVRDELKQRPASYPQLQANQGLVFIFNVRNRTALACTGGSDDALLQTGRAFFLRWPYLWEVWGRDTGATFQSIEDDLTRFLAEDGIKLHRTIIKQALYEFPVRPAAASPGLGALKFNQGLIESMAIEIHFMERKDMEKAQESLALLQRQRQRGLRTDVLNYQSCRRLDFELRHDNAVSRIFLPSMGSPRRLLTPSFKDGPVRDPAGKDFDLMSLETTSGFYSDQDKDGVNDGIDSIIVVPEGPAARGVAELASRLTMPTAGASFPLVYMDREIESRRSLAAPILVGWNALSKELVRTGKMKQPALESAWGLVRVVPGAFGKSNALVITADDQAGLDKTLSYFSRTFPYFDDFGAGRPSFQTAESAVEKFLKGGNKAAEAFFLLKTRQTLNGLDPASLDGLQVRMVTPAPDAGFEGRFRHSLETRFPGAQVKVETAALSSGRTVFQTEKEFEWEAAEAMDLVKSKVGLLGRDEPKEKVAVSLGLSESPEMRARLKADVEKMLAEAGFTDFSVEVMSAYKQGFFWLTEKVIPALKGKPVARLNVKFAAVDEDFSKPKRTYSDPARWLHELYPADEFAARELNLPLDKIEMEMKSGGVPVYEARAYDDKGSVILAQDFSPRTRETDLSGILPDWGKAVVTTGWCRIESGRRTVVDADLKTDLERFWAFYQDEALKQVVAYINKKTGGSPTFSKQPYFKRLSVELWASEPDYKLGLDEEIVSSLESIHDEIYFDTLDLLRGVTGFDPEDKEVPEDTSRISAPGNVMPLVHGLAEGGKTRVKVTLDDQLAAKPEITLTWKTKGGEEKTAVFAFPDLKPKSLTVPAFIYNGQAGRVEEMDVETEWEKEADYLAFVDILDAFRDPDFEGMLETPFSFPNLARMSIGLKQGDRSKSFSLAVRAPETAKAAAAAAVTGTDPADATPIVPTDRLITPEMCVDLAGKLAGLPGIRSYTAGVSYEGRSVPVLEVYLPVEKYVSIQRLETVKPTLLLNARQHANEVSSTNYSLRFAELLSRDRTYREALKKVNVVIEPMENPDGAALACELNRNEPFHCLHAGRYSSLGVDIQTQLGLAKPILPEALVRTGLMAKWQPDVFLNLHGYPSHEWVQQFSYYTPYLFRDYWVPKGWFTYFKALQLPVYEQYRAPALELMNFIIKEFQAEDKLGKSNKLFYSRYERWAERWSPLVAPLEVYDGLNIYYKRRSDAENRLNKSVAATFVEQTPEVMDETALGQWLDFICGQGLTYLRANLKFLAQAKYETARLEEESRDRVRFTLVRTRPPEPTKSK